ncbi:MAG TPA: PKD domain-containing protein [Candidatus Thermoplasmatota archaeon]|nr:PKD domain-containing protein [Candidatus Thermoplasmatota archaeon]
MRAPLVLLTAAALLAAGCTGKLGLSNAASIDAPTFTVTPESGDGSTTFTVDAGKLADGMEATWDFGDGTILTGRTASHAYGFTNGEMTITLLLTKDGKQGIATKTVKLGTGKNANPTARLTASPTWAEVGKPVSLDARPDDRDKDPLKVAWSKRKDGDPEVLALDATGNATTLTFDAPGRYVVGVRVSDPKGGVVSRNVTVDVSKRIPERTAQWTWNGTLVAGTAGQGLAEKVWGTPAPDAPATVDAARHGYSLKYPASTFVMLTWNDTSQQGAFDLDLELRDAQNQTVFKSETRAPAAPFEMNFTQQEPGDYTVVVRAVSGAKVDYSLTVYASLQVTPEMVNRVET